MPTVYNDPIMLDSTGQDIVTKLDDIATLMGDGVIDDTSTVATDKTWSINKISEVDNKLQNGVIANTKLIKDTVGWSGKNKNGSKYTGITTQGMTFTVNPDNSVKGNGTNSSSSMEARPIYTNFNLKAGSYKFSCKNATANFYAFVWDVTNSRRLVTVTDSADHEFSVDSDIEAGVLLSVITEVTINNQTLYPMIRDADILDSTYEPYFGSTAFPRSEQAVLGAVNELTYPYKDTTKTTEGVTYTDDGSGIIVANSNGATGNALFQIKASSVPYAIDHDVYLSGCPSGGSSTTYEIYLWDETISKGYNCYGEPVLIPASTYGHNVNINIRLRAGQTANNMIFKPMLSMSPLTPYAPYAMTNRELTEKVIPKNNSYKTEFETYLQALDSNLSVQTAYLYRLGNLVIFQSRINKSASTAVNIANENIPSFLPKPISAAYGMFSCIVDSANSMIDSNGKMWIGISANDNRTWFDLLYVYLTN